MVLRRLEDRREVWACVEDERHRRQRETIMEENREEVKNILKAFRGQKKMYRKINTARRR